MAKKDNGALLIRLRADIDGLRASLDAADKTISQRVSAINKEKSTIKLGWDVQIAEAQAAGKMTEVLRLKREKMLEVIKLERLELEQLQKAYEKAEGKNKERLAQQVARQRIKIAKNESYLNTLQGPDLKTKAISELEQQFPAIASGINLVKSAIAGLNPVAGAVVATAGAFALMKNHVDETRESLLKVADSTYKITEHLSDLADLTQLPIGDVEKLAEACKVAGANIDAIAPALNRLDKAVLGGDKTLEQFGIKLTDSAGNLKGTAEQLQALADGYSRLKSEGRGAEFVAQLGKQAGALLPLISRLSDADFGNVQEMLKNAPKLGTMLEEDAKYIGELDRALETLSERLTKAQGAEATQLKINEVTRAIEEAQKEMEVFLKTADSRAYERMGIDAIDEQFKNLNLSIIEAKGSLKALAAEMTGYLTLRAAFLAKNLSEGNFSLEDNSIDAFKKWQAELQIQADDQRRQRENDRIDAILGRKKMAEQKPEEYATTVRNDIEKNFAYASVERKEALFNQRMQEYSKQREAIAKKEAENKEKIAKENADKRLSLEKQLRDALATEQERKTNAINDRYETNKKTDPVLAERIKNAELQRLAQENAQAEQRKAEEEKRKQEELVNARKQAMDKIRAITNTDFQNRMEQIEKEKQAWIKAGADRAAAEIASQKQIAQARMSEAEKLLTEQKAVLRDIQKGYSDDEIKQRSDARFMKQRGWKPGDLDTLERVGTEKVAELGNSRERLLSRFAKGAGGGGLTVQTPVTINFDNTVVEDTSAMDKLADKIAVKMTTVIKEELHKGGQYGF